MKVVEIEGITCAGKTTVASALRKMFEKDGIRYKIVKEPGGTHLGRKLRSILLSNEGEKLSDLCRMMLFIAGRADIWDDLRSINDVDLVVFDRYVGSTFVYQCKSDIVLKNVLSSINLSCGFELDYSIIIDVDPEVAFDRLVNRMEKAPRENEKGLSKDTFLSMNESIRKAFGRYALCSRYCTEGKKILGSIVNGDAPVDDVSSDVYRIIKEEVLKA